MVTAYDDRAELMRLATLLDQQRVAFQRTVSDINRIVARLVGAGDAMLTDAAETSPEGGATVKRVTYSAPADAEKFPEKSVVSAWVGEIAGAGERGCSLCGRKGHRKTTPCPNAHLVETARRGKK